MYINSNMQRFTNNNTEIQLIPTNGCNSDNIFLTASYPARKLPMMLVFIQLALTICGIASSFRAI